VGLVQNNYYGAFSCKKEANDENPQLQVVEIFFYEKRVADYFGLRNADLDHINKVV